MSKSPSLVILGLPFTHADLDTAVQECLNVIQLNRSEGDFSHATVRKSTLLGKIYGWRPTAITYPELLATSRRTRISLPSGKFFSWLSARLGSPLLPSIDPAGFLHALCRALSDQEKSVFILGGTDKLTKNAAVRLHDHFRGLRIVGIATPLIFTEGEDLVNSRERDAILVEQINASQADVLLVNLGSPKQELWLERVRYQLKVPLALTADDSLKSFDKGKDNAVETSRDWPGTIKKRIIGSVDTLKIGWMSLCLIVYHTINRLVFKCFHETENSKELNKGSQLFLSAHRSIAVISLPLLMDAANADGLFRRFEEASGHDVIVLDFSLVRHIQPEGFYFLVNVWQKRSKRNKEMYGLSAASDIKCLMKMHRVWDLLKDSLCDSAEALMSRLANNGEITTFYDTFTQQENLVIISLLGALDNKLDYEAYQNKLMPVIGQKDCALNLNYCTFIDNSGFSFLLGLRKHLQSQQRRLTLCSVSRSLKRQFHNAGVHSLFSFAPSLDEC